MAITNKEAAEEVSECATIIGDFIDNHLQEFNAHILLDALIAVSMGVIMQEHSNPNEDEAAKHLQQAVSDFNETFRELQAREVN